MNGTIWYEYGVKFKPPSVVINCFIFKRFSPGALLNIVNDYWKLIRIGQAPVGLGNYYLSNNVKIQLHFHVKIQL